MRDRAPPPGQLPPLPYTVPPWGAPSVIHQPFTVDVVVQGVIRHSYTLDDSRGYYVVGRTAVRDRVHLSTHHPTTSRQHAVLQYHSVDGSLHIYDLQSTHGTYLHKSQVASRQHIQLYTGDQLRFGSTTSDNALYILKAGNEVYRPAAQVQQPQQLSAEQRKLQQLSQSFQRQQEKLNSAHSLKDVDVEADEADVDRELTDSALEVTEDGLRVRAGVTLTANQQKLYDRYNSKRIKMSSISSDRANLQQKAEAQSEGATAGQQHQMELLEKRVEQLVAELAQQEQALMQAFNQHGAQPNERGLCGGRGKFHDSDEEDDMYDRTQLEANRRKQRHAPATATVAEVPDTRTLSSSDDVRNAMQQLEKQRNAHRSALKHVVLQMSQQVKCSAGDELDDYVQHIDTTVSNSRKDELKKQLQSLQQHYIQLEALLKQREGEERAKKVVWSQMQMQLQRLQHSDISESADSTSGQLSTAAALRLGQQREADRIAQEQQTRDAAQQQASAELAATDSLDATASSEDPSIPTFLMPSALAALGATTEERTRKLEEQFQQQRAKYATPSAAASTNTSASKRSTGPAHGPSPAADDQQGGLVKRARTTQAAALASDVGNTAAIPSFEALPLASDDVSNTVSTWQAPSQQTGSGRTKLNDKFGY